MNSKHILLIFPLLLSIFTCRAQSQENYEQTVKQMSRYYNGRQADSIYYLFSDSLKKRMPVSQVAQKMEKLHSQVGDMRTYGLAYEREGVVFCSIGFTNTMLSLMIKLDEDLKVVIFRFIPYQGDTLKKNSNFFLATDKGTIYGTLSQPTGSNRIPCVIIVPGSAPLDKDGNAAYVLRSNMYKMLADSLVRHGIACLRYDTRGVGESAAALTVEDELRLDDLVNDAAGLTKRLKQFWRFDKVVILGHGDGALVGIKAAEKENVAGLISIDGMAQRMDKVIEQQLAEESKGLSKRAKKVLDSIRNGYPVKFIEPRLEPMFSRGGQAYIRSWMQYTPRAEIKKLTIPVLLIHGTADLQADGHETKKLEKATGTAATYIEGMNHVLKQVTGDRNANEATYMDPTLPVSAGLVSAVVQFVNNLK